MHWEGGYANNQGDAGGETYKGVSRNNFPFWSGWELVDGHKNQPGFPANLAADSELQFAVHEFYQTTFWKFDGLISQAIANKIFDCCVNLGTHRAVAIFQKAAGVPVDGVYGALTQGALNNTPQDDLLDAVHSALVSYYTNLAEEVPTDAQFLNGWLARANA